MVKDFCALCNSKINKCFTLVVERENRIEIIEGPIRLLFKEGEVGISTSKLKHPFIIETSNLSISYMEEDNLFYCELQDSKNNITYVAKQKRMLNANVLDELEYKEVLINVIGDGFTLAHYNIIYPDIIEENGTIHITSEDTDDTCSFFIKDIEKIYIDKETEEIQYICLEKSDIVTEIFFIN